MATENNTIKTTVELDVNKAQQEIVKLNSLASDSTEELSTRLEAKNKQIKVQNELNKKNIKDLENLVSTLKGVEGSEKDLEKAINKLNKAKLNEVKVNERNNKQQKKLQSSYDDSKGALNKLDNATGGFITKLKALAANPIVLTITLLAAAFQVLQKAVARSGKASDTFAKISSKLTGVMNGFLAVLEPVVEFIGDKLLKALEDPQTAIEELGESIKQNLINRLKSFMVFGEAFVELLKGNFSKAAKLGGDAIIQFTSGIENGTDKIQEFGKEAVKNFNEASKATVDLAGAEKQLVRNRIALEKQQLSSLKAAEEERQIRDDTSKSIAERIAANERLGNILDEQAKKELAIAQQSLNLARLKQVADGQTIESMEAVGDAEIKLLEIQERIGGQRSEQLVNENSLLKEGEELKKQADADELVRRELQAENIERDREAQLEIDEYELQRKRDLGEATLADELAFLEKKRLQDISSEDLRQSEIDAINKKYENQSDRLKRISEKATEESEDAKLESKIKSTAEAFGIQKEAALVESTIALGKSIGDAWAANAKLGFPGNVIATAAQVAAQIPPIVKSISAIKSARFSKGSGKSGGGGGGASAASAGGGASIASIPTATSTSIADIGSLNAARNETSLSSEATRTASANVSGSSSGSVVFSETSYNDFQNQVDFKEDLTSI